MGAEASQRDPEVPEKLVQEFLGSNLHLLGIGALELVGLEYQVPSGRIDILAKHAEGRLIAIEVKRGMATRDAVGQLQSYLGDLMIDKGTEGVSGCLVALGLDAAAKSALLATPTIEFWSYKTLFTFSQVPIHRPSPKKVAQRPGQPTSSGRICHYCGSDQLGILKDDGRTYCKKCGNFLTRV